MLQEGDWKSIKVLWQRNGRSEDGRILKRGGKRGTTSGVGMGKRTRSGPSALWYDFGSLSLWTWIRAFKRR